MTKAATPLTALANLTAKRKPKQPTAPARLQLSLPLWPEAVRGVPNAVLRGSLFSVSKVRSTAKKRDLLAAVDGIEIRFKGERFNQVDLDLWEMLLHLARLQPLGNQVEFTAYGLLKELGRGTSGKHHEELKEGIARLIGGVVEISWLKEGKTFGGALVSNFYRDDDKQRYIVTLDPKMVGLYEGGYSYIDWSRRKALKGNSLAKWLQGFYASHAHPYPYKVETLRNLCGSTTGRLGDFRKLLRPALDELVAVGSIAGWTLDDSDLLHIVNVPTASQSRHLPRNSVV